MKVKKEVEVTVKPCPFCRADNEALFEVIENKKFDFLNKGYNWKVHCTDCDTYGPSAPSSFDAIEKWNNGITR